jgi:hypothetical protein
MRPESLRNEPLGYLPALIALAMAALSLPTRANTQLLSLCSGTTLPASPTKNGKSDCDSACHVGCQRQKKWDRSGRLC